MQLSKQKRERCHRQLLLCMACSVKQRLSEFVFVSAHKRGKNMGTTPEGIQRGRRQMTRKFQGNDHQMSNPSLESLCYDIIVWLYGACLANYGWYIRCFDGFNFCPTGMMFSKLLQLLTTIPATALCYFIHKYEGACFFKWNSSGTKMILVFEVAKDSLLGVDKEITRPNSEVI